MAETLNKVFIDVEVDASIAGDAELAEQARGSLPRRHLRGDRCPASRSSSENLDECVLCNLCVDAAPEGSVRVVKLYES